MSAPNSQKVHADNIEAMIASLLSVVQYDMRASAEKDLRALVAMLSGPSGSEATVIQDYEDVLADKRRLTRELDVAMHGEADAAKQASLCDLIPLAKVLRKDAERYRWLRNEEVGKMQRMDWMNYMDPMDLDAAIDKGMSAATSGTGQ